MWVSEKYSNSNQLRETAEAEGVDSYIVDFKYEFDLDLLKGKEILGISSGASVPSSIVNELTNRISAVYPDATVIQKESVEKGIEFPLPKKLEDFKVGN